jgi:TolB protein
MRRVPRLANALLAVVLLWGSAGADDRGVPEVDLGGVVTGRAALMRIELENFVIPGGAPDAPKWMRELDDVLARNLEYSDLFDITRWYIYPDQPAHPDSRALVRGTIEKVADGWVLRGRVEELPGRRVVFEQVYRWMSSDQARQSALRFADDVVHRLTGFTGLARTRIAYVRSEKGAKELWVVDFDGENPVQLTSDRTMHLSPAWSPDGMKLVHTTYLRGRPELSIFDLRTRERRLVSAGPGMHTGGAWSPDGRVLAFSHATDGDSDIYLMGPDGTGIRRITRSRGIEVSPTWSRSGREIAFVSDRSGSPQIYVMDVGGGGERRITFSGSYNAAPAWSPTKEEIVFVSRDGDTLNLYLMDASGDGLRPLVFGRGDCDEPSWAPDGRHVVFSGRRGSDRRVYVRDVTTQRERALTTGSADCYGPAWSPVPK